MKLLLFHTLAALAAAAVLLAGCEGGTEPNSSGIPIGIYTNVEQGVQGGLETRHVRTILIPTQTGGHLYDTIFTMRNGAWEMDSTAETELRFQLVGDGYQRTVEIRRDSSAPADSSIAYWYFFRRGDSLYHYTGQRLLGNNVGIVGSWESDPRDTAFTHRYYALRFTADSVSVTYKDHPVGDLSGIYPYKAVGSTLTIQGLPLTLGSRYEVVPGWSLYLTTQATRGYKAR
jgi:hypothetical protein